MLFHFTQAQYANPLVNQTGLSAYDRLRKILREGCLNGAAGNIKGSHQCVCFTEAPIGEIGPFFKMVNAADPTLVRYQPYGIAVSKNWLFAQGGRPVIYQPVAEYDHLPPSHQWRHVSYAPPETDFAWEREWRIKTPQLQITPNDCIVVVPTAREAHGINYELSQISYGTNQQTGQQIIYSNATWVAVSLDLYGL